MPADEASVLPVGIALPPSLGKVPVALRIPTDVPWRQHPPLTLDPVRLGAPYSWQATITAGLTLAGRLGLMPRVFGALLLETLTGLTYVPARSDLDLLWPGVETACLPALIEGLAAIEWDAPLRLDGEVPSAAVGMNWRELAKTSAPEPHLVLVKGLDDIRLQQVPHLLPGI